MGYTISVLMRPFSLAPCTSSSLDQWWSLFD